MHSPYPCPCRKTLPWWVYLLAAALVLSVVARAQTQVEVQPGPTLTTYVESDGSGNPIYICRADPNDSRNAITFSVANSNLTNVVVATNTATATFPANHGFQAGYKLVVSGSGTAALNGTYAVVTANPASTTLTFTTSGVGDGTYTDMSLFTDAPLLTKAVWSILKNNYSGTNFVSGLTSGGNLRSYNYICANRSAVNGANVITYK